MGQKTDLLVPILERQPVIPVLIIEDVTNGLALARALMQGGLSVIEITLRSAVALDAIATISRELPEVIVGAGTVLDQTGYHKAERAGARFIVTPGADDELFEAASSSPVPMLPGAITPSEIVSACKRGYTYLKFFPAQQAGGVDFVKALASPFSSIKFCPTGGITQANARQWLALTNVVCVGGSWLAPADLVRHGDWRAISQFARQAARLK